MIQTPGSPVIERDEMAGLLKRAVYIHPTLAEGFWMLVEGVKPAE